MEAKGGMLWHWLLKEHARPTSDLDLQIFGEATHAEILDLFTEAASLIDDEDGLRFEIGKMTELAHTHSEMPGLRIQLVAYLGDSKTGRGVNIHADVGIGGEMPMGARYELVEPLIEGMSKSYVRMQPFDLVAAEKLHAVVEKGMDNTRLKDYRDLWVLSHRDDLVNGLAEAVEHTFSERTTPLSCELPMGLSQAYAIVRQGDWERFLTKSGLAGTVPTNLSDVVSRLAAKFGPVLRELAPAPSHVYAYAPRMTA
jgi:hypothetical protein